ncbi:MAG: hypothetical protein PHC75_05920 [Burkholderiales bacterium]|nr:hypothetical protein [Burkholderiales bacterium]
MTKHSRAVFTISSKNYIHYAVTLLNSVNNQHNDVDLFLILVDKKEDVNLESSNIKIIWVEDLDIPNFEKISFKYNILELNTNVKPTVFKKLLKSYEKVVYLDPDIYVYNSLSYIFDTLDKYCIAVTPHMIMPQYIHHHDKLDIVSEVENLKTGAYNLGFIALSRHDESIKLLDWWESCCLCCAIDEHESGVFVDQKWLSLATCYFESIKVIRHSGMNVAYWNIHERNISAKDDTILANDEPLVFFHFSGHNYVDGNVNKLSKHLLEYSVENGSLLSQMLLDYTKVVSENKKLLAIFQNSDYGFAKFSNGEFIEDLTRRIYFKYAKDFSGNPFDINESFYKFAKSNSLTSGIYSKKSKVDMIELKNSNKVQVLETIMKFIHKLLGVSKFSLLLRFLRHYSITANYAKVFRSKIDEKNTTH